MPGTDELRSFLEERLLVFDPDVDLTDGSPAQVDVIDPTVERFTPDPFEVDVETFIKARLQSEYPDLSVEESEALADLLIKPTEALLDPVVREVEFLRKNKSLNSPELLSPEEADALMGNIFVARNRGEKSGGSARLYFNAPTAVSLTVSNEASTASGLKFIPSYPQEISAEAMLYNQDGSLFYFDVVLEAEQEGDEYNIEPREINAITNVSAAVKITNLARFRDGTPEESTLAYVDRGESSLTERSLIVPRGAYARLFDQFGDLQHLQVVGYKDPEMTRDVITGGGLGAIVLYGTDGSTEDDGDGDGYSSYFGSVAGGFVANIGAVGTVDNFTLTIEGKDYSIVEVLSDGLCKVTETDGGRSELSDALTTKQFYIRQNALTLSGIPGGIVNPTGPNGTVVFEENEVHIGGCADFLVRGTSLQEAEAVIEAVSDEHPLVEGTTLQTKMSGAPASVVKDASKDFVALDVRVGNTLVIVTDAGNAGTYQVTKVAPSGNDTLQVEPEPGSTVNDQVYKIVDTIDVDLNEPKTVRDRGTDLKTVLGSYQVSTVAEVDFDALGVEAGDTLRVGGDTANTGDYTVSQITGTGNKLLVLASPMRRTSSSETWSVFKLQDGVETPIVRVSSIELLDSAQQPTGDIVPYADPIDVKSYAFSNIGIGQKKEVSDAVLGILGREDLSVVTLSTLNGLKVRLTLNASSTYTTTFSAVSSVQDIADQINTACGRTLAEIVTVGAEQRLSIRSRNNWIVVDKSFNANPILGLADGSVDLDYDDDNRQLISDSVVDWTVLDIEAEKDSVYVLTGDNVEFWYLQQVDANRLFISRVDDDGKAVFPLSDARATVRLGSRSFGKVRCYFLEPTSFEVRGAYRKAALKVSDPPVAGEQAPNITYGEISQDEVERTEFSLDVFGDGSAYYRFFPDPALEHDVLPTPDESVPNNLYIIAGTNYVESEKPSPTDLGKESRHNEIDFLSREVLPGDILEITYQPIQGSTDITHTGSPPPLDYSSVVSKTLIVSLENGPDKTVTFSAQCIGPNKLVAEINAQLGTTLAYVEDLTVTKHLRLEADFSIVVGAGTANSLLGLTTDENNEANAAGEYSISDVGYISGATSNNKRLTVSSKIGDALWSSFTSVHAGPSQHFLIKRPGVQRVSSTTMQDNQEHGLYYADIELVSYGPGDEFNLEPDEQLEVTQHQSDGYTLSSSDDDLTFSGDEELTLHLSRRILPPGSTDEPAQMQMLSQRNIQVSYDRSELVQQVQTFSSSELDRVLNASVLVKHLLPHFVRFDMTYQGGSSASIVSGDIEDHIDGLLPDEVLEASALSDLARRRGASRVEMPITLIGLVHQTDRKIRATRSEDAISRGRTATFLADVLNIVREDIS